MVERSDWRRYDNDKYSGLTRREIRSFVSPSDVPSFANERQQKCSWFSGTFFVLEDTVSNMVKVARSVSESIPSDFYFDANGKMTVHADKGYPTYRSFPVVPKDELKVGSKWKGMSYRAVDPLNKNVFTKLEMYVEYTVTGEETYKNEQVYRIKAQWATRYGNQWRDYEGDPDLKSATGSHKADILISKETGNIVFANDNLDETFVYNDGQKVRYKGITLMFTEYPPSVDTEKLKPIINRIIAKNTKPDANEGKDKPKITPGEKIHPEQSNPTKNPPEKTEPQKIVVEKTTAGLRLSLRDIKFLPNSDEIVPTELSRIDEIAEVLKAADNAQFLIEGHTAGIGEVSGEKELSIARAKKMADELTKRGIANDRFLYAGYGRDKPIATNDTVEGRAQNRRVEITILE